MNQPHFPPSKDCFSNHINFSIIGGTPSNSNSIFSTTLSRVLEEQGEDRENHPHPEIKRKKIQEDPKK